jgi:hypothetical protein
MGSESTFKKNGGYFIDGIAYMDCKTTGEPVANVSLDAVSVTGSIALIKKCLGLLSDSEREKVFGVNKGTTTSKPRGWRWMKEFVEGDGTVYHKGVVQPSLKGKRPITDVVALREERKNAKETKAVQHEKALLKMAAEKKELKSAMAAQKDFLNHKKQGGE